ncbi:tape measure protein [Oscillibacter sp.]|uniref:tape measure protein n=1 Tax=Oscillibacter sp. TaxID=1945593 RepID=UPI00289D5290|nr:tape measure protein [Oscillibacter sp.]
MAESISIIMKMNEDVTGKMKSIASMSQGCSKELEELGQRTLALGKRYQTLNENAAKAASKAAEVKKAMDEAAKAFKKSEDAADKVTFEKLKTEYNELTASASSWQKMSKTAMKEMTDSYETMRKMDAGMVSSGGGGAISSGGNSGGAGLLGALASAGLLKLGGDAIAQAANSMVGSALGDVGGSLVSGVLSGAASGAALGSVIPGLGTAIGAAIGGAAGLVTSGTQAFGGYDDAFKSYVQENTEGQLSQRDADIQSGSAVASQREQDAIAFNTMLGEGVGDTYLKDLRTLAADTPMEYGDLTAMSRSLATGFKDDPSRMLGLMTSIGNAGSAVGADAGGMNTMATAMARMQSSGKASLEYINLIQERGVDAVGMLADGLGKSKAKIYEMISAGKIGGINAVNIIQQAMDKMYAGAMEKQSQTFGGLTSTLEDAQAEIQNAYGEGYNAERGKGISEQTDYLSGSSGERQMEANRAIGAWQASLENAKEKAIRDAVDSAMDSEAYREAEATGDAVKMGEMIARAKVQGQNEYNASEGAQLALESERALAKSIRDDTGTNQDYWDAGYEKGNWYTKGLADAIRGSNFNPKAAGYSYDLITNTWSDGKGNYYDETTGNRYKSSHAFGLRRVPETGLYLLHQDESVRTAAESRAGSGDAVQPLITGNVFNVRKESDIPAIASELLQQIQLAGMRAE